MLLAVELLLFEFRPRSLIPVALACAAATAVRYLLQGTAPVFPMPALAAPGAMALFLYVLLGALVGVVGVWTTRIVYAVEDWFEKLPIHWMWWPAIGGVVVGVVGYFAPRTLGVGYDNIENILNGRLTLAGAGVPVRDEVRLLVDRAGQRHLRRHAGAAVHHRRRRSARWLGVGVATVAPQLGVDPRIAALVGMAAIFAGASRALLAVGGVRLRDHAASRSACCRCSAAAPRPTSSRAC